MESKYFQLREVADGEYAAIAVSGAGALGNAAIVDLGGATLVVDTTMNLQAARDLADAAERLTGRKADYVFNTHWHADHINGNQVFAPNAKFISTATTRNMMTGFVRDRLADHLARRDELNAELDEWAKGIEQETDPKLRQEMEWGVSGEREYVRTLPELRLTLPTITFEQELVLHGDRRNVKLITYGGGHTQSDGFAYLPEEKILIAGDLVLSGFHLVMSQANPREWLKILDRIGDLDIEKIIPGHGEVCGKEAVGVAQEYINDLFDLVAGLEPDDDLQDLEMPEKYRDWNFSFDFKGNLNLLRNKR